MDDMTHLDQIPEGCDDPASVEGSIGTGTIWEEGNP